MNHLFKIFIFSFLIAFVSCQESGKQTAKADTESTAPIFNRVPETSSGIGFQNKLTETDSINYFNFTYMYMGGGVAVGDVNNDGLDDVLFTGNQVPNKLYLNKGNLLFEDITKAAGVAGDDRWYTGAAMVDINSDGLLDIYCSVGGKFDPKKNELYINNGDGTFTEKAAEFGLDDRGNSIQATFFDYDKDGDLDVYVANYPPTRFDAPNFYYTYQMKNLKDIDSDHLYRNDGNGKFTDVTEAAGVKNFGLSLSATVGDLNNDGYPDLYVSNDFSTPDYLYMNNGDGTFREVVKTVMPHTAFYGMGVDIADYNNDGLLDIYQVDMDAKSNRRKKANMASMNPDLFWSTVNAGFHYQYMQNSLQTNTGMTVDGNPFFTDMSRITETSSTDWSWGPLFADFDNDGLKDLYVSNGTRREINNNDYFNMLKKEQKLKEKDSLLEFSLHIPSEKLDNFMFQNKGDLNFEIANKEWGIEYAGFSNGVAYADFDNDGDLEIVLNNIDDTAVLFNNSSAEKSNYVKIRFNGSENNRFGLGARAYVTTDSLEQMQELTLSRGFQSSVAPVLHFGVGDYTEIDKIEVIWPDGKKETVANVKSNQDLTFDHSNATAFQKENKTGQTLFSTATDTLQFPNYEHRENEYNDFEKEILLPHRTSTFGPALAVGDLNGDGKEDFFIGGSATYQGAVFYQTVNGFEQIDAPFLKEDKAYEDVGALIFDANDDGYNDLYVVSGGNEFSPKSEMLQDRLYINNGQGGFTKAADALPEMHTSGSKVIEADFDKDGKKDLFVLGRLVPAHYPSPAKSYILKNTGTDGKAKYIDITDEIAPHFNALGMATDAEFVDVTGDGNNEIVVVGEWMPIKVFAYKNGTYSDISEDLGLTEDTTGWWWSVKSADFDKDGDLDFIVGNLGLNYKYKATPEETFDVYFNDFDSDKKMDIVLGYYNKGKQYPVRGRQCSSQQMPGIKNKFPDYESFSVATLEDVYTDEALEDALHYQVKSFSSVYLENDGGQLKIHELPNKAQTSSINSILIDDYDADGKLDALIAGNLFWSEVETPRNDAGYGYFLKGDGNGDFAPVSPRKSGFFTPGDVKNMSKIKVGSKSMIILVKNNDKLQFVESLEKVSEKAL